MIGVTDGSPVVLRNEGTRNHWLGLSLVGAKLNRQGLGARVVVTDNANRRQTFDVSSAGSYLSSNDPRIVVGLGAATGVRSVEIRWPRGKKQQLNNPTLDRYLAINDATR